MKNKIKLFMKTLPFTFCFFFLVQAVFLANCLRFYDEAFLFLFTIWSCTFFCSLVIAIFYLFHMPGFIHWLKDYTPENSRIDFRKLFEKYMDNRGKAKAKNIQNQSLLKTLQHKSN